MHFPLKVAGEKLLESEVQGLRRDLLNLGADYQTTTGSAGAYVLAIEAQVTALEDGQIFAFMPNHTCPGASTINVNAIGAVAFRKQSPAGLIPLSPGDIVSGCIAIAQYDGTYVQLMNPRGNLNGATYVVATGETITANQRVAKTSTADQIEAVIRHHLENPGAAASHGIGTATLGASCKVASRKFATLMRNSTNAWKVIVGSVDPVTLAVTFGSAVDVSATSFAAQCDICYMSDDKIAIVYTDSSGDLYVVVATVSGNTVTLGTGVLLYSSGADSTAGATISCIDTDKLGVAYLRSTGTMVVVGCSVSGTTVTADTANQQTETTWNTNNNTGNIDSCKLTTDKMLVCAQTSTGTGRSKAVTFSGTVPTLGANYTFDSGTQVTEISCDQITTDQAIICWRDGSGTPSSHVLRATLSGTAISYDTTYNFDSNHGVGNFTVSTHHKVVVISTTRAFVVRRRTSDGYMVLNELDLNSGVIAIQKDRVIESSSVNVMGIAYVDSTKLKIAVISSNNAYALGEYDNISKCVGVATHAADEGELLGVQKVGPLAGFSSLTVGTLYYHDFKSDTPTTTNTGFLLGVAIDTDEIDLECKRVSYGKSVVMFRCEQAGTGRQKVYHGLGYVPQIVRSHASLVDDNESAGYVRRICNGWYRSSTDYGVMQEGDASGYSTSTMNETAVGLIDCDSSVANITAIDEYSITLNFTTHTSTQMYTNGMYAKLDFDV